MKYDNAIVDAFKTTVLDVAHARSSSLSTPRRPSVSFRNVIHSDRAFNTSNKLVFPVFGKLFSGSPEGATVYFAPICYMSQTPVTWPSISIPYIQPALKCLRARNQK